MNHYISVRATQEQYEKELRRRQAVIQSGYAFIVLELIDRRKRRVSGIDDLNPLPTEMEGRYNFEVVSRQLQFEPDPNRGGAWCAYVLYTDRNCRFLASHLDCGYWEIVSVISGRKQRLVLDEVIEKLEKLRDDLAKASVSTINKNVPELLPADSKPYDIANVDEEVLVRELQRREEQKQIEVNKRVPENPGGLKDSAVVEEQPEVPEKKRRGRGKGKGIVESKKEDSVVEDSKEDPVVDNGAPDSVFLNKSIGVQQP